MFLRCRDRDVSLRSVAVMGVLNVTPDSFSDGGLWVDPADAIAHGYDMASEGAAIIDVGGESTRPGAQPVPIEEELARVVPVITGLAAEVGVPISIDTRRAVVARAALEAGASVVNDTAGEASEPEMVRLVAATGAAIIVMHSRGSPQTMGDLTSYSDVVKEVASFLVERADRLQASGVGQESIVFDPGFGFAKTGEQNLEMLSRLDELTGLGVPVLAGTSRKSFIGRVLDAGTEERLEGTLATLVWAVTKGVRIVRVHDVLPAVRAVRMTEAIQNAQSNGGL